MHTVWRVVNVVLTVHADFNLVKCNLLMPVIVCKIPSSTYSLLNHTLTFLFVNKKPQLQFSISIQNSIVIRFSWNRFTDEYLYIKRILYISKYHKHICVFWNVYIIKLGVSMSTIIIHNFHAIFKKREATKTRFHNNNITRFEHHKLRANEWESDSICVSRVFINEYEAEIMLLHFNIIRVLYTLCIWNDIYLVVVGIYAVCVFCDGTWFIDSAGSALSMGDSGFEGARRL